MLQQEILWLQHSQHSEMKVLAVVGDDMAALGRKSGVVLHAILQVIHQVVGGRSSEPRYLLIPCIACIWRIMFCILVLSPIIFIILRVSSNCFISLFTASTLLPLPRAMR